MESLKKVKPYGASVAMAEAVMREANGKFFKNLDSLKD